MALVTGDMTFKPLNKGWLGGLDLQSLNLVLNKMGGQNYES